MGDGGGGALGSSHFCTCAVLIQHYLLLLIMFLNMFVWLHKLFFTHAHIFWFIKYNQPTKLKTNFIYPEANFSAIRYHVFLVDWHWFFSLAGSQAWSNILKWTLLHTNKLRMVLIYREEMWKIKGAGLPGDVQSYWRNQKKKKKPAQIIPD